MTRPKEKIVRKFSQYINRWRQPHLLPAIYAAFLSLGALFTLLSVLRSKSESENAFFLGYSLEKMVLGAGLLFFLLVFLSLTVKLIRQPEWSRHVWEFVFLNRSASTVLLWIAFAVFIICWIVLFLPFYRLAGMAGYVSQLRSVIVWLAVVGAVTMLLVILESGKESIASTIPGGWQVAWASLVILLLFILVGGLVVSTGLGLQHPGDYWYASGVPVLGLQILLALAAGAFLLWMEPRWGGRPSYLLDVLMCLGIWLVTAWLWAREPLQPNFFMPDTLDNLMYPYSDSATFDVGSQFALIGQGIFNGQYFDRALYIALLTYLHMLFGQNLDLMMTAQAVIFAVFPVVMYLIGREVHSRALGVSVAVLIILRGLNSLVASKWIDLASPKMILTDFATAIGVAVFVFLVLKWFREPSKWHLAVWTGGALGLTIMLRTHALLLLPVLIFYLWIKFRPQWKVAALGTVLLIFGMLVSTTPWDLRNRPNGIPMFYVYYYRIEEVLRARYGVQGSIPDAQPPELASVHNSRAQVQTGNLTRQRIAGLAAADYCDSSLCRIVNHFFHNFITSFLFLPTSFVFDDLWNTIKLSTPYWKNSWLGEGIGFSTGIFLFINMALISLGFGAMWVRNRIASLIPVSFFLTYIFSNALAFTSGGRYIVPVDWILGLYYMAGLLQLAIWALKLAGWQTSPEILSFGLEEKLPKLQFPARFSGVASAFVIVFAIGSLIPLSETPFERRYPTRSEDEILTLLEQKGMFGQTSFDRQDLIAFLSDPQADILVGRLLYPRYYPAGMGEMDRHYPYRPLDFSRHVFMVIGPFGNGRQSVIIEGDKSDFITHAADVVVVGCKNELNLDGLVVFELSDPSHVYVRSPEPEWKCPLPLPPVP